MSFTFSIFQKQVPETLPVQTESDRSTELLKWVILGTTLVASGLIVTAPRGEVKTVYMPPVTEDERAMDIQKMREYSRVLDNPVHTKEDYLRLANVLSQLGEREAAQNAYLQMMSHSSNDHLD